jgi:DNA-binding beta-propeller fold protein YncE
MHIGTLRLTATCALSSVFIASCAGSGTLGGPPAGNPGDPSGPAASLGFAQGVPSIALPSLARALRPSSAVAPAAAGVPGNGHWIYLAQLYGNDLGVYRQGHGGITFFETLTQGVSQPQGTVATPTGWWYVANGGDSNVLVYRSKRSGPVPASANLDDAGQFPVNVDVTPDRQTVAVSNVSTVSLGPGSVSVYLDRATEPARTLTYKSGNVRGEGVAIDHRGNCYWSFNDATSGSGSVVEFAKCRGSGTPIVIGIGVAGGILFDQKDDLFYIDQEAGIYKCSFTRNCKLFSTGFGDPVNMNFDHKQKLLWVADATGYVDTVDPKTGKIVTSTPVGGASGPPFGIAPSPGGG